MTEKMMKKWSKHFWGDWAERVGTTLIYGLITIFTVDDGFTKDQMWKIVVIPFILSALKGLLKNLTSSSEEPTASLIDVSSYPTE
jgi:hypothetical protein